MPWPPGVALREPRTSPQVKAACLLLCSVSGAFSRGTETTGRGSWRRLAVGRRNGIRALFTTHPTSQGLGGARQGAEATHTLGDGLTPNLVPWTQTRTVWSEGIRFQT